MADLAQSIQLPVEGEIETMEVPLVAGAEEVYKGSIMISDVSASDGYSTPMSTGITAAVGDIFMGVSIDRVSIPSGASAGDYKATVIKKGLVGFLPASLAITDLGAAIYCSDDQVLTTSSTSTLWIGYLKQIRDGRAWVEVGEAFGRPNVAT